MEKFKTEQRKKPKKYFLVSEFCLFVDKMFIFIKAFHLKKKEKLFFQNLLWKEFL
jgi:hypothetical protein